MTKRPITVIIKLITDQWSSSKIMLGTTESGLSEKISDKAKVDKSGPMAPCMRVGGKTIRLTAKED